MKNLSKEIAIAIIASLIAAGIIAFIPKMIHPSYNVGDVISFGHYEQDNNSENDSEPIEWYVLAKEDDRYLLLSKFILDAHYYHHEDVDVSWENCDLRQWLDQFFLRSAFTVEERKKIQTVINENPDNDQEGTKGGNATKDKVFLLSIPEAKKYLSLDNGLGYSTDYAVSKGAVSLDPYKELPENLDDNVLNVSERNWKDSDEEMYIVITRNTSWFLRSPGFRQSSAAYIRNKYYTETFSSISELISPYGSLASNKMGGIRPAIWYKP